MRSTVVLIVLLSATASLTLANSNAQEGHGQLRCTAAAIGTGGLRTRPVTTNLDVVVERWSTEAERSLQVFLLQADLPILLEVSDCCQRHGVPVSVATPAFRRAHSTHQALACRRRRLGD